MRREHPGFMDINVTHNLTHPVSVLKYFRNQEAYEIADSPAKIEIRSCAAGEVQ